VIPLDAYAILHVHIPLLMEVNSLELDEQGEPEVVVVQMIEMPGYYCFHQVVCYN
jgi:hypothetical protein